MRQIMRIGRSGIHSKVQTLRLWWPVIAETLNDKKVEPHIARRSYLRTLTLNLALDVALSAKNDDSGSRLSNRR